jgi:two-component system, response regulator YesN
MRFPMYKIMIVDDEEIVRRSIVNIINWNDIGFELPTQACDGVEALALALQLKPDIIIADIKMPNMDGLELASKVKELLPETQVIIFSGHDEFKFAQESISLGVLDYILKPIGSIKLTTKLKEIRDKLDQDFQRRHYLVKIQEQLHHSLPLLKESFLTGLVCSPNNAIYSASRMHALDISLSTGPYVIALVAPDSALIAANQIDVYQFAFKNIALETLGDTHPFFTDSTGRLVIIFSMGSFPLHYQTREMIIDTLSVLHKAILLYVEVSATIGIGSLVNHTEDLFRSYNDANTALDCQYLLGKGKVYDFYDLNFKEPEFYFPFDENAIFVNAVKTNDHSGILLALEHISDKLKSKTQLTSANVKFVFIELITNLTKLLAEAKPVPKDLWHQCLHLYTSIEQLDSIDNIVKVIQPVAISIAIQLNSLWLTSSNNLIIKAKTFVQNQFNDEMLSLNMVADHINVSSGYLSAIFKKETGINFSNYLTQQRMEKAMQLLATTDKNVYEIAFETGFSNPHYFSISFKKFTKLSPSDYRDKLKQQPL